MGKAQASSATCVEMVRGAEVFLTKSKEGDQGDDPCSVNTA